MRYFAREPPRSTTRGEGPVLDPSQNAVLACITNSCGRLHGVLAKRGLGFDRWQLLMTETYGSCMRTAGRVLGKAVVRILSSEAREAAEVA